MGGDSLHDVTIVGTGLGHQAYFFISYLPGTQHTALFSVTKEQLVITISS